MYLSTWPKKHARGTKNRKNESCEYMNKNNAQAQVGETNKFIVFGSERTGKGKIDYTTFFLNQTTPSSSTTHRNSSFFMVWWCLMVELCWVLFYAFYCCCCCCCCSSGPACGCSAYRRPFCSPWRVFWWEIDAFAAATMQALVNYGGMILLICFFLEFMVVGLWWLLGKL